MADELAEFQAMQATLLAEPPAELDSIVDLARFNQAGMTPDEVEAAAKYPTEEGDGEGSMQWLSDECDKRLSERPVGVYYMSGEREVAYSVPILQC